MEDQTNTKIETLIDKLLFYGICAEFFLLPIATSPAVIVGLFVIIILILSGRLFRDFFIYFNQEWFSAVFLFTILPFIGLLYTTDVVLGLNYTKKTYYWILPLAMVSTTLSREKQKIYIYFFLCGVLVTALISIFQYMEILPMRRGHLMTGMMSHIIISLFFSSGIHILSYIFYKTDDVKIKKYIIALMILFFIGLTLSSGRIGYLTFIVLSPWIAMNIVGREKLLRTIMAVLAVIVLLFFSATVRERTLMAVDEVRMYISGEKVSTNVGLRLHMYVSGIKIIMDNPFIGVGTGGIRNEMEKYRNRLEVPQTIKHPQNSFLFMTMSYGIPGLISVIWIFYIFIRKGWRSRDSLHGFAVFSYGIVLLIGSFTDTQIISYATSSLFALMMGLDTSREQGTPAG